MNTTKDNELISTQNQIQPSKVIKKRFFEVWESNSTVLCQGKFMIGSDIKFALGTFLLINIPAIIYEIFVATALANIGDKWISFIIGLILLIMTDIFFFLTLVKDPGIIPRNMPIYDNDKQKTNIPFKVVIRRPHIETNINTHLIRIKYCTTCHIYRPPRTSHCNICDNCVERFDHHCPWLGICIGKRNYRIFYAFVFWTTFLDLHVFATSLVHMIIQGIQYGNFVDFLHDFPASLIIGSISFLAIFFIVGLCGFHTYLLATNQTTYENIKKSWKTISGNPYSKKKIFKNLWKMISFPIRKSFLELQKIVFINVESYTDNQFNDSSNKNNCTNTNTPYNDNLAKEVNKKKNERKPSLEISTINKLELNAMIQINDQNKSGSNVEIQNNPNKKILDELDGPSSNVIPKNEFTIFDQGQKIKYLENYIPESHELDQKEIEFNSTDTNYSLIKKIISGQSSNNSEKVKNGKTDNIPKNGENNDDLNSDNSPNKPFSEPNNIKKTIHKVSNEHYNLENGLNGDHARKNSLILPNVDNESPKQLNGKVHENEDDSDDLILKKNLIKSKLENNSEFRTDISNNKEKFKNEILINENIKNFKDIPKEAIIENKINEQIKEIIQLQRQCSNNFFTLQIGEKAFVFRNKDKSKKQKINNFNQILVRKQLNEITNFVSFP